METAGAMKVRRLVETKIVIEPGRLPVWWHHWDEEKRQAWLQDWAKEFREFLRDHRSQDVNGVSVEPTYQIQCSACHREWEEHFDEDSGKTCCASCGEAMAVVA
jgi:hypothetical protein